MPSKRTEATMRYFVFISCVWALQTSLHAQEATRQVSQDLAIVELDDFDLGVSPSHVVETCDRLLRASNVTLTKEMRARVLARRAEAHAVQRHSEEAERDFLAALAAAADSAKPTLYCKLARFYIRSDQASKAIPVLEKAKDLSPNLPAIFALRGCAYHYQGDDKAALAELKRATDLDKTDPLAYRVRATILGKQRKFKESLESLEESMRYDPHQGEPEILYCMKGHLYIFLRQYDASISSFKIALRIDPKLRGGYTGLCSAYYFSGKYRTCCLVAERGLAEFPDDLDILSKYLGAVTWLGEFEKGESIVQAMLKGKGLQADDFVCFAVHYAAQGKYEQAISYLRKALEKDENLYDANYALASIQSSCPDARFRDGKNALAIAKRLAKENESEPGKANRLLLLAKAYAETGQMRLALDTVGEVALLKDVPEPVRAHAISLQRSFERNQPYRFDDGRPTLLYFSLTPSQD